MVSLKMMTVDVLTLSTELFRGMRETQFFRKGHLHQILLVQPENTFIQVSNKLLISRTDPSMPGIQKCGEQLEFFLLEYLMIILILLVRAQQFS